MVCITVSTEVLYPPKRQRRTRRSAYEVDFWREVKKRWLVFGVLCAVFAAVVAPNFAAARGPLHPEYTSYLPLSYIYYVAGRRGVGAPRARDVMLAVVSAHALMPAAAVVTTRVFGGLDARVVKGAIVTSAGSPCGWLSLCVCRSPRAAPLVAAVYLSSLVAAPAFKLLICGRATIPHFGGILSTMLTTGTPFLLGWLLKTTEMPTTSNETTNSLRNSTESTMLLRKPTTRPTKSSTDTTKWGEVASKWEKVAEKWSEVSAKWSEVSSKWSEVTKKCCMLFLLYCACGERLRDVAGVLYVGDVLATLALVVCTSACFAALSTATARALLSPPPAWRWRDVTLILAVALPKTFDYGWESSASCMPAGLSRLPAVFQLPAHALLLAAVNGGGGGYDGGDGREGGLGQELPQ